MEVNLAKSSVVHDADSQSGELSFQKYIPDYLFKSSRIKGRFKDKLFFKIAYLILKPLALLILRPRGGKVGDLGQAEVEKVYSREARKYNYKHHLTTRGMDLVWRNWTAQSVCIFAINKNSDSLKLLDLCTGTGLTLKCINDQLNSRNIQMELTGLDYNEEMLTIARNELGNKNRVTLVRGDATKLINNKLEQFHSFEPFEFDIVTQMFGIGGIHEPLMNLKEVLKVLKVGGQYVMVDMHRPIASQPGEFFLFGRFFSMPYFEQEAYERLILPIALNRLWGWRDTTLLFYVAPLLTYFDPIINQYYGFSTEHFEFENQRWIFSLPLMPVAKIKLRKQLLTENEAIERNAILSKVVTYFNLKFDLNEM